MGSQSCYGDQALEVLKSLVECRGLVPHNVAKRFAERFSETSDYGPLPQDGLYNGSKQEVRDLPIKGPWRHISIAGFLKNIKHGKQFPQCGTGDAQADCFVRVVPVAALYAGHPELLDRVEEVVRVTQDNPAAIAVGKAMAKVLEALILFGSNGQQAITNAIDELAHQGKQSDLEGFCGRVANTMKSCLDLSGSSLYDAVLHFGDGAYSTSMVS
jgi:ADP-ribosylglycohydrolase